MSYIRVLCISLSIYIYIYRERERYTHTHTVSIHISMLYIEFVSGCLRIEFVSGCLRIYFAYGLILFGDKGQGRKGLRLFLYVLFGGNRARTNGAEVTRTKAGFGWSPAQGLFRGPNISQLNCIDFKFWILHPRAS